MTMRDKLLSYLDKLLPPGYRESGDASLLLRARVLMAMTLMYLSSTVSIALAIAISNLMGILTLWSAVMSSSISSLLYFLVLVCFRRTGNLFWSANIFLFTLTVATAAFTYITGGLSSPVAMILPCVTACAFLMATRALAMIWTIVLAMGYGILYLLDQRGFVFPQVVDSNLLDLLELFSWIYAWLILVGGMVLFAGFARTLSSTLNTEREQLRIKASYDSLTGAYTRQYLTERLGQYLRVCHQPGRAFLFLDIDIQAQALLNREEEEALLKRAVQALQSRYPGRVEPARSSGLSLLAVLRDVGDADRASECTAAIYMALRDTLDESLVRVQIGAVMVPAYAEAEREILNAARRASQDAGKAQQSLVLYTDAQRIRLEKWTPKNWTFRRYSEVVG